MGRVKLPEADADIMGSLMAEVLVPAGEFEHRPASFCHLRPSLFLALSRSLHAAGSHSNGEAGRVLL
jgi:hypothetical protein